MASFCSFYIFTQTTQLHEAKGPLIGFFSIVIFLVGAYKVKADYSSGFFKMTRSDRFN